MNFINEEDWSKMANACLQTGEELRDITQRLYSLQPDMEILSGRLIKLTDCMDGYARNFKEAI